jgi:hypothetical protein
MKRGLNLVLALLLLVLTSQTFAQDSRRRQIELFAGAAFPLAPDAFKEFYKVGGSIHGQYVIFPSPTVGISFGVAAEVFTVDQEAILEFFGLQGTGVEVEGSASIVELGIGIRPYLTPQTANMQFFVFGMGTFNAIEDEATVTFAGTSETVKQEGSKFGVAAGAGFEIPAGEKINIIIQGLTRFIFTEDETTSFIGVTGGIVF